MRQSLALLLGLSQACTGDPQDWMATIPKAAGPLRLEISYPAPGRVPQGAITVLGTVGTGDASVLLDGEPLRVAANGAFVGVRVPVAGGEQIHRVVAILGRDTITRELRAATTVPRRAAAEWPAPFWRRSGRDGAVVRIELRLGPGDSARVTRPGRSHEWIGRSSLAGNDSVYALEVSLASRKRGDSLYLRRRGVRRVTAIPMPPTMARSKGLYPVARRHLIMALNDGSGDPPTSTAQLFAGTSLLVLGARADSVQVSAGDGYSGWIDAASVTMSEDPGGVPVRLGDGLEPPYARNGSRIIDVPSSRPPLVRVEWERDRLRIRLFDPEGFQPLSPAVRPGWAVRMAARDSTTLELEIPLPDRMAGYDVTWEAGNLRIAVKRAPTRVSDWRVLIDAGHPPGGAVGAMGTRESDVTLAIARRTAALLAQRGFDVFMSRNDRAPRSLIARLDAARRAQADLMISIHADASPDGVDPATRAGTTTYFLHPHAEELAEAVQDAVSGRLRTPDLGVFARDLAMIRPTTAIAVLCEIATLSIPEYEYLLGTDAFQGAAAAALADGVSGYVTKLLARTQGVRPGVPRAGGVNGTSHRLEPRPHEMGTGSGPSGSRPISRHG